MHFLWQSFFFLSHWSFLHAMNRRDIEMQPSNRRILLCLSKVRTIACITTYINPSRINPKVQFLSQIRAWNHPLSQFRPPLTMKRRIKTPSLLNPFSPPSKLTNSKTTCLPSAFFPIPLRNSNLAFADTWPLERMFSWGSLHQQSHLPPEWKSLMKWNWRVNIWTPRRSSYIDSQAMDEGGSNFSHLWWYPLEMG